MLVKGDKIRLIKPMGVFTNVGEVCDVYDVIDNIIMFSFGNGMHMGCMSTNEFEKYFEKVETAAKAPTITSEHIEKILENSDITWQTVFDKCTLVTCRLPNGFIITESSACVNPKNYDEKMGLDICLEKIRDKIWELEGYRLQEEIYRDSTECPYGCDDCYNCPCDGSEPCDEREEHDECLDTDLDCDDCDDTNCPYNPLYITH